MRSGRAFAVAEARGLRPQRSITRADHDPLGASRSRAVLPGRGYRISSHGQRALELHGMGRCAGLSGRQILDDAAQTIARHRENSIDLEGANSQGSNAQQPTKRAKLYYERGTRFICGDVGRSVFVGT